MRLRTNKASWRLSAFVLAAPFFIVALAPLSAQAETPFQASQRFIETGQTTEARRTLESELRIRPDNVEARYNLAILLEQAGHKSDAISLYRENFATSRHLPSLANLASALKESGKTTEAQQWLEKGTTVLKHEATPWYMLAAISEQQGNITQATTQHRKALKADPLNGYAYLHYAAFQSRHKLADHGIKQGDKATRLLPDCAPCWRMYGDILRYSRMQQKALTAYQRSLAIDPSKQTRQQLISTLRSLGYKQRADQIQRGLDAESNLKPESK